MLKKTLLSLAIAASTVGLTACNLSSIADNNTVDTNPAVSGTTGNTGPTKPIFSAANKTLPLMIDLLYIDAAITDGTASTDDTTPPVTTALNSLEGSSTVAPIDIEFTAGLDIDSIQEKYAVNLIKLRNAGDDPRIDALYLSDSIIPISAENNQTVFSDESDQPVLGEDYDVSFFLLDDGKTQNLRISLINPLEAKTKYIVALTSKIKDSKGDTITPSSEYSLLSEDLDLPSALLEPVRVLIKSYETITTDFFASTDSGLDKSDIVLSYAFTTGGTSEVLLAMAAPQIFVEELASQPVGAERLVFAAVRNASNSDEAAANAEAAAVILEFVTAAAAAEDIDFANANNPTAAEIKTVKATAAFENAILAEANGRIADITATLATPGPRPVKLIQAEANSDPLGLLPTTFETYKLSTAGITTPASPDVQINFIQGQIELPVGLSKPELTDTSNPDAISAAVRLSFAQDSVWQAADELTPVSDNKRLNNETGLLTSDGVTQVTNADGSTSFSGGRTSVNYRYPLAKLDQVENAPLLMTVPSKNFDYTLFGGKNCLTTVGPTGKYPVVIYAHAVTADRASSIAVGTAMAVNCYVTIAIDLPSHGVAPVSNNNEGEAGGNVFFGFNVEQPNGTVAGLEGGDDIETKFAENAAADPDGNFANIEERHRNLAAAAGSSARIPMDFDGTDDTPAIGSSGSFFFNVGNLGRLRDNFRQGAVDLMHLNASLVNVDIDGDGVGDLDTDNVYFAGSSLGSMVGAAFVAVNNNAAVQAKNPNLPLIKGVVLSSPGGSLTKIFENSPAVTPQVLGGLNLAQDASNLQKYQTVLQATLNSADVINFADLLRNDNTPVMMYGMIGGGSCRPTAAPGSCSDGADRFPANLITADNKYPADNVIPNFDYFKTDDTRNPFTNNLVDLSYDLNGTQTFLKGNEASGAPLVGTTPLAEQMGLTQINATNISDSAAVAAANKKIYMPFDQGSHVTFITSDDSASFTSMIAQMVAFFDSEGDALNSTTNSPGNAPNFQDSKDFTDGIAPVQENYTPVEGQ
jgi:pimeloyl-ACP methyl ester carboxylesterase